jgi:(3,5-dihydroxyphenyl)acetyl-CoA 1,2-dioxygenase
MIFSGHTIRAGEPGAGQFCDEVVAATDMDAAVHGTAGRLSNPAVVANRRVMNDGEEPMDAFRVYMAGYAYEQTRRLYSADLIANLEHTWINRRR